MVKLHCKGQFLNVGDETGTPFNSIEFDIDNIVVKIPIEEEEFLKVLEVDKATLVVLNSGQELLFYTDLVNFNKSISPLRQGTIDAPQKKFD